jgi:hypothetical protein
MMKFKKIDSISIKELHIQDMVRELQNHCFIFDFFENENYLIMIKTIDILDMKDILEW